MRPLNAGAFYRKNGKQFCYTSYLLYQDNPLVIIAVCYSAITFHCRQIKQYTQKTGIASF